MMFVHQVFPQGHRCVGGGLWVGTMQFHRCDHPFTQQPLPWRFHPPAFPPTPPDSPGEPIEDPGAMQTGVPTGWVCPLCKTVHAPHVNHCLCELDLDSTA